MIGYFNSYTQKYWQDNRKIQTYTELGLSLLLMVIFLAFAIRPTLATVLELNKKLHEAQTANQRLDAKIKSLNDAQAKLDKNRKLLTLANEAIPTEEKLLLDSLNQIQLLAEKYHLTITGLKHAGRGKASPSNPIRTLDFGLSGQGNYNDIEQFVTHLENLPRIVQIKTLGVATAKGNQTGSSQTEVQAETQGTTLTLSLTGETYYYKGSKTTAKNNQPANSSTPQRPSNQ